MGVLEQAQGGSMVPQLAEAAAQAGAPAPGAGEPPPGGPPPGAALGGPPPGAAPTAAGKSGGVQLPTQEASSQEQQEYERAMRAVVRVLYGNDETARGIVDQIDPNDVVSSTSKVGMLFVKELDRKINMHESVVAEITQEAVTRIAELAEARHGVTYKQQDMEKIIGATWEGVQSMFGGDPEQFTQSVRSMPQETLQAIKTQHEQILASGGMQGQDNG